MSLTQATCAPILTKLPFISKMVRGWGSFPAKQGEILDKLVKERRSVQVALDGIAGMFR